MRASCGAFAHGVAKVEDGKKSAVTKKHQTKKQQQRIATKMLFFFVNENGRFFCGKYIAVSFFCSECVCVFLFKWIC